MIATFEAPILLQLSCVCR